MNIKKIATHTARGTGAFAAGSLTMGLVAGLATGPGVIPALVGLGVMKGIMYATKTKEEKENRKVGK